MTTDDDRLHTEIDRQLDDIRTDCDGLATRAGLFITAAGIIASLIAARIDKLNSGLKDSLLMLGISIFFGVLTISPWLKTGPRATTLYLLMANGPSAKTSSLLYDAKVVLLDGCATRRSVMRLFLVLQTATTIIAIIVGLWFVSGNKT